MNIRFEKYVGKNQTKTINVPFSDVQRVYRFGFNTKYTEVLLKSEGPILVKGNFERIRALVDYSDVEMTPPKPLESC